jgi:hypothetical protein
VPVPGGVRVGSGVSRRMAAISPIRASNVAARTATDEHPFASE